MKRLIGDQNFYRKIMMIAFPIIVQNGITNFVGMLDNIMVGQVGTIQMSAVSISNQLIFVYNLCIFGALSGAGIFTAQYFGNRDKEGIQYSFRYKWMISLVVTILGLCIFLLFGNALIGFYLNGEGNIKDTLFYGKQYLNIMMVGIPFFMVSQIYSDTLRETSNSVVPMKSGLIAVAVNLVGNYILIYGKFGLPALGSAGAAFATVLSRFVEMVCNVSWTHRHREECFFMDGMYKTFKIPFSLLKTYFITGFPLLLNETMWAAGLAMLTQCYSTRGLDVVASLNISNTITNVSGTVFIAMGISVGILVGQLLGAQQIEQARDTVVKSCAFSIFVCFGIMIVMFFVAPIFPKIYNTKPEIQSLSTKIILLSTLFMPLQSYINCVYFVMRAGGKTFVTFLFDSAYVWAISVPAAFIISRYTTLPVQMIYLVVQLLDIIKVIVGSILIKKGIWIQTLLRE
ncbi:MAG: MATE family efflux transporter [Holdemanella sp.]|nr:MATE family efflux transporter [Holdemanella sp.]